MRTGPTGEPHDPPDQAPTRGAHLHSPGDPACRCFEPAGRPQDYPHPQPEAAVAGPLRRGAAALQPPLPGKPPGLQGSGTGLRRFEARDPGPARGPRRAVRRGQGRGPAHPRRRQADRRHAAHPRIPGRRARRDGHPQRLRIPGPPLPVPLRHRPRHHRDPLERAGRVFFGLRPSRGAA